MDAVITWLQTAPLWQAALALLGENAVILLLAVAGGEWLAWIFRHRRVAPLAHPLKRIEVWTTVSTVLTNTITTIVGLHLWRAGVIRFRDDVGVWAWIDVVVLLLIMDIAMYVLHRVAHHPWIYGWLHRLHHEFDRPRPLTLFILHPLENLSFGMLWLLTISLYNASWLGMSIYLMLNVLFGTIGHLGVEPFPVWWGRIPVLRYVGGSTFHARHHQDVSCNFGFYTLLWDRLFGTLRRDYFESIGVLPQWVTGEVPGIQELNGSSSSRASSEE